MAKKRKVVHHTSGLGTTGCGLSTILLELGTYSYVTTGVTCKRCKASSAYRQAMGLGPKRRRRRKF